MSSNWRCNTARAMYLTCTRQQLPEDDDEFQPSDAARATLAAR